MYSQLRTAIRSNYILRKFFGYFLISTGLFDSYIKNYKLSDAWIKRIDNVLISKDNEYINRVKDAGKISNGVQKMHNGLKIYLGSYYGPEVAIMLQKNKGVHEPQEERVFQEVLKLIPKNAVMIEMGSFWSFYSMWFQSNVENAKNYMIEPDAFNLGQGRRNFKLNKLNGDFTQAFVSSEYSNGKIPIISVDYFVELKKIDKIHILHSDIQGYEFEMLNGAKDALAQKKIDYIFISTHSNDLHYKCLNFLLEHNFFIISEVDLDNTFSEDGLIVASAEHILSRNKVEISSKNSH